jgi:hypothetical protein
MCALGGPDDGEGWTTQPDGCSDGAGRRIRYSGRETSASASPESLGQVRASHGLMRFGEIELARTLVGRRRWPASELLPAVSAPRLESPRPVRRRTPRCGTPPWRPPRRVLDLRARTMIRVLWSSIGRRPSYREDIFTSPLGRTLSLTSDRPLREDRAAGSPARVERTEARCPSGRRASVHQSLTRGVQRRLSTVSWDHPVARRGLLARWAVKPMAASRRARSGLCSHFAPGSSRSLSCPRLGLRA